MEQTIIPNLTFESKDWERLTAEKIFLTINERNHPELPVLSASQEFGMILRDEGGMNIFHDKANEVTYKKVNPGQFVIHLRSFQGGFAHSKVEGITSPAYTILDFKDKARHNDLFWKYVFSSEEFIKRLELITYGIRDGRTINFSDFAELEFYVPSQTEQKKIGTMLSKIDSLIQAKTQKLESLKSVKKSLLQKCFPKDGETVPQMRFEGFSGDWEEKKLGDIAEFLDSKRIPIEDSERKHGIYPYYGASGIIDYVDDYIFDGDYVLLGEDGANITNRSTRLAFVVTGKCWINNHAHVLSPRKNTDLFFLSECLENQNYESYNTGTAQPKLNQEVCFNILLKIPNSKGEQQKIGQFFSKYDSLISLQQKEIENLKTIKKSLLQKMFV